MPSSRPCAAFEPISPEFNLSHLVERNDNFEYAVRIHCDMIDHQGLDAFERLVLVHVILGGKPLVIEGYETRLDKWTFALQWLRDNCGKTVVDARDLTKQVNIPMSIGHYLKHMFLLTNQWDYKNYKDSERQRMYLKDIDCPSIWQEKLADQVPSSLFYLNESTGKTGGFGTIDELDNDGIGYKKGRGIAKAGDLMSCLPKEMRAENLMCYIGHEGTYTPAHREMCASLGYNIMVEASKDGIEEGKSNKAGSSIWFMTETKERDVVSEYWLSRLGHDIEVEKHFAQINAWKNAPFKTYVVEQKPGDFILIPPLAPHQVWNRGTRTMKVAWNRTTVETLELALNEALPKARMVCRDEQYKNKAIVFYTLQKYSKLLRMADKFKQKNPTPGQDTNDVKVRQLGKDFKRLHALFTRVLISESFFPNQVAKKVDFIAFESNITCSYCRCNIFNRFLTCPSCVGDLLDGEQDTYDICMDCYAMGRSCACISKLKWVEQFHWNELVQKHDQWRQQIIQMEGEMNEKSPRSLKLELERLNNKRTLAQICQLELIKRPWRDIRKPEAPVEGVEREEEIKVDDNGIVRKKRKVKRSDKFVREHGRCHVDCYWEPKWKQAQCTNCDKNYCYGNLFRAYDEMPQDIMANPLWKCPSCRKICSCRHCRNKPGYKVYIPRGTLLGHNTKAVADARSVESLVDFSFSNLGWIQKAGDDHDSQDTRRMQRRRKEAEAAKATDPQLGDHYVDTEAPAPNQGIEGGILRLAEQEGIPIDPALASMEHFGPVDTNSDEDEVYENPEEARRLPGQNLRDSQGSPFALPEGGIVRNEERAYCDTNAITFVYPDPDDNIPPPAPVFEGYVPAESAYAEPEPDSPDELEMTERKRKRPKSDEGSKPYKYKQAKPKAKKRLSLVVKLSISKEKLAQTQSMASLAQAALKGIAAPVVSSDLEALNQDFPTVVSQPPQKRVREDAENEEQIDEDDEYAPSRYRDRRLPALDGQPRPRPDADITRRTTRTQQVRYEEPDEEDFNETVQSKSRNSKLATMEQAIMPSVEAEVNAGDNDGSIYNDHTNAKSSEHASTSPKMARLTVNSTLLAPVIPDKQGEDKARTTRSLSTLDQQATSGSEDSRPPSPSSVDSHDGEVRALAQAQAQAQANRKAKMAAIEFANHEDDDLSDAWSDGEPVSKAQPATKLVAKSNPDRPSARSAISAKRGASKSAALQKRISIPKRLPSPTTLQTKQPAVVPKASVNDWADSDSSEEDIPYRVESVVSKFTPVNGNHATLTRRLGNHPGGSGLLTAKRGRGRPPSRLK